MVQGSDGSGLRQHPTYDGANGVSPKVGFGLCALHSFLFRLVSSSVHAAQSDEGQR